MKLTDLDRERGIGANCMFVELGPFRLLVDSGMHPKRLGLDALPRFNEVEDGTVDFILLTHCHLDHIGSLPVAVRRHPTAQVLCSLPSVSLGPRMLRNSCNVMGKQREELGIAEYPLFTFGEIARLEEKLMPMLFGQPRRFSVKGEELEITFFAAGHVAGAAGIRLVYKHRAIFFTGDVLFRDQRILKGAAFPAQHFDTIVTETTRGATETLDDPTRAGEIERFITVLRHTLERGGSVIVPVFAFGRMQEILTLLLEARKQRELPASPVFCSGLGLDLVDYFDVITRKTGLLHFRRQVLKELKVRSLKKLIQPGRGLPEAGLYVVSSGMIVENTPSYAAAAAAMRNPHNAICFVGYCDPQTMGGRILATEADEPLTFEALDYVVERRAHVERFDLSGHADREELADYALRGDPRTIVLTHGDPEARDWFMDKFTECAPKVRLHNPEPGVTVEV